jgi:GDPmannose 4,6-dehydratase
MRDNGLLENALNIVKPDMIIHLASISSSHYAFNNPTDAIYANGTLVSALCEFIHKHNWTTKLFNASSSEIYKGHVHYTVSDGDTNMFHLHPYSISKIMGHSIVDFYRTVHNRPFSNGVIFTTESHLKNPEFLLNKVAKHINYWKLGKRETLTIGNLDSYRNIIHASDVANAIHVLMCSDYYGSVLICNTETNQMEDLIKRLFVLSGLPVEFGEHEVIVNGEVILQIDPAPVSDSIATNINGFPAKLMELGWNPLMSVDDVLRSLL